MKVPSVTRGMVQTALGSMFYLMSDGRNNSTAVDKPDSKPPILCFHMSPRSSDEFIDVLPLLAAESEEDDGRVVIAFDLPGYGASDNPPSSCTMDEISEACLKAADALLEPKTKSQYVGLGSLLGNFCCLSLAQNHPDRMRAGILTNPWYNPGASGMTRSKEDTSPIPDDFVLKEDGSHLMDLYKKRNSWLDEDLNFRVVQSEMAYLSNRKKRYSNGINIEGGNDYSFTSAAAKIVAQRTNSNDDCKFLCVQGKQCANLFDMIGLEGTKRFEEASTLLNEDETNEVRVVTLEGEKSTLNLVNQMPEEFASICKEFLADNKL